MREAHLSRTHSNGKRRRRKPVMAPESSTLLTMHA
jgi:hypothetical protein